MANEIVSKNLPPTQKILIDSSGYILESKGNISALSFKSKEKLSLSEDFLIIESMLPVFKTVLASEDNLLIPKVESKKGLLKGKIYDLLVKKVIQNNQILFLCTLQDYTERYLKEAKIQQKQQEQMIRLQTKFL